MSAFAFQQLYATTIGLEIRSLRITLNHYVPPLSYPIVALLFLLMGLYSVEYLVSHHKMLYPRRSGSSYSVHDVFIVYIIAC